MKTARDQMICKLMELSANGDSSADNVLTMLDNNEENAREASAEQLSSWYENGKAD